MLVAWADGEFQAEERAVLRDYVRESCGHIAGYEIEPIIDWAGRQFPVADRVSRLLARIVETDGDGSRMDRLVAAAVKLARADGVIVEDELQVVKGIKFARRMGLLELGYPDVCTFSMGWAFDVPLPAFCDALDLSYDQRMVKKKITHVWTRGNPAEPCFRAGDMFHAGHALRPSLTLQVVQVQDSLDLSEPSIVSFKIYRVEGGKLAGAGVGALPASDFELMLREGYDRLAPFLAHSASPREPG